MDLWRSLSGMVELELISADTARTLQVLNDTGIAVFDVVWIDDLTVRFRARRGDHRKLRKLVEGRGDRLRIKSRNGVYWLLRGTVARPVLMAGVLLILFLSLWIPSRIFFVQVEGNAAIPARQILEEAQNCGITFGADRREVRSERMKNALLEAVPELQWAGINTIGCTAVISVRERTVSEKQENVPQISSIIASADGVITEMTVTRGTPLCRVGQAVKAGQVLVSGYTDCGICIRAEQAQAEIFAETVRDLTVITPAEFVKKGDVIRSEKKYSLLIGKKRINFSNSSGILDTTCDKMYLEMYMLLPGGFRLPVALVIEQWTWREETAAELEEAAAGAVLSDFARSYLEQHMIAGQIRQRYEPLLNNEGVFLQHGKYVCTEMICKTRIEEKLPDYAEAD